MDNTPAHQHTMITRMHQQTITIQVLRLQLVPAINTFPHQINKDQLEMAATIHNQDINTKRNGTFLL